MRGTGSSFIVSVFVLVCCVVVVTGQLSSSDAVVPQQYVQEMAPWPQDKSPLNVNFSMKINNIVEANDKNTAVIVDCYFRVTWLDSRLLYPQTTEPQIIMNPVILDKVWLPDPYIFNVRSVQGIRILKDVQGVILYKDLTIFVSTVMKIDLGCSSHFQSYPFDTQTCILSIYSYMYEPKQMDMNWLESGLVLDPALENSLTNYDLKVTQRPNNYTCYCHKCIPVRAPCVEAQLTLQRKVLGYLLGTYLPSGLFVAVSWASFFWPSDVIPGRTVLVVTSLLTLVSMHTGVRHASPDTSYMKAVDVWMIMCIIISTLTLFEYGIVLMIMKAKTKKKTTSTKLIKQVQVQPATKIISFKPEHFPRRAEEENENVNKASVDLEEKVEMAARYLVPLIFLFFNIIYWPYYILPSSK